MIACGEFLVQEREYDLNTVHFAFFGPYRQKGRKIENAENDKRIQKSVLGLTKIVQAEPDVGTRRGALWSFLQRCQGFALRLAPRYG